ncbi:MAG: L,D-transpeptidase [Longimicrobiales bacterium]
MSRQRPFQRMRDGRRVARVLAVALVPLSGAVASASALQATKVAQHVASATVPAPSRVATIFISTTDRMLWLVSGRDTLFAAPIAIGMGKDFEYNGRKYHFSTPTGERTVIGKSPDPIWTPPDWHYYEKAARKGLEAVHLNADSKLQLSDGSFLVVRGDQVGRINQFGHFATFTPGNEIIFDGMIFIPPLSSAQRRVPDALGPYKLDMGDGYLIHGTHIYNKESIGQAVSHGCVRMRNEDVTRLYAMVEPGTKVVIF